MVQRDDTMLRQTMQFPPKLWQELRREAIKRLDEMGMLGVKGYRPIARDIICVALKMSLTKIKEMDEDELRKRIANAIQ